MPRRILSRIFHNYLKEVHLTFTFNQSHIKITTSICYKHNYGMTTFSQSVVLISLHALYIIHGSWIVEINNVSSVLGGGSCYYYSTDCLSGNSDSDLSLSIPVTFAPELVVLQRRLQQRPW